MPRCGDRVVRGAVLRADRGADVADRGRCHRGVVRPDEVGVRVCGAANLVQSQRTRSAKIATTQATRGAEFNIIYASVAVIFTYITVCLKGSI